MHERLLGEELSVEQIVQVARFLRRKAEQTYRNAMTLYEGSRRAFDETGRLAESARAAAVRVAHLRR